MGKTMNGVHGLALGLIVLVAVLPLSQAWAGASIVDDFDSYATGALSTVSGGTWRLWGGVGNDAQVVTGGLSNPNAARFDTTYGDVVSYADQDLLAGGSATLSFSFFASSTSNDNMALSVVVGSGNPGDNSVDYDNKVVDIIIGGYDYNGDGDLDINVNLWFPDRPEQGLNFPLLTYVTPDAWHQLSVEALSTGAFNVYIDGVWVGSDSFDALTNPNGLNCAEIWTARVSPTYDATGYYLIDDFSLTGAELPTVPVPGAMLLVSLGSAAVALCRRKRIL
jgi:hypothetical protein